MPTAVICSLPRRRSRRGVLAPRGRAPAVGADRRRASPRSPTAATADAPAPGEEADDEADPEGARHQGRRRHGPEDQARAEALPAPQRPEGRRRRRPGHAALARPRRPDRRTARWTPPRRRSRPTPRPSSARSPSASPAATSTAVSADGQLLRQVPVLAGDVGGDGRHRQPRRGRRGHAGRVASRLYQQRGTALAGLLRADPDRLSAAGSGRGPCRVDGAAFLRDLDSPIPSATRRRSISGRKSSPSAARPRTGRSSCPRRAASRSRIVRSISASLTATAASPASRIRSSLPACRRRPRWPGRPW